jgi:hypothetical protein
MDDVAAFTISSYLQVIYVKLDSLLDVEHAGTRFQPNTSGFFHQSLMHFGTHSGLPHR